MRDKTRVNARERQKSSNRAHFLCEVLSEVQKIPLDCEGKYVKLELRRSGAANVLWKAERGTCMKLREIQTVLEAQVLCGEDMLDREVHSACASDFMSDVLAFVKDQALLLTGMVNPQVVRTAEMMDMKCIVFVRGKVPDESIVEMARERGIVVMTSTARMFTASGLLFTKGLVG